MGTYTIPEGCISLPRAYDEYLKSAYQLGSSDASDDHKANAEADLVRAFGREELVALVRRSGADAIDQIPAESWLREEWPGRSFLSPTIESVWEWSSLSGLTPFVRSEDFRGWLRRHLNAAEPRSVAFDGVPLDQDPMELPHWSIGITLAWIISRSPQWMKDLRNLSVAVLETSVDYSGPLSEAKGALLHALRAGELKASGKPSGQSRCEIDPMEWLDLTFQYELVEGNMVLLAVKHDREASGKWSATAYTDIRINRTAVTQREWKLRSDHTPRTAADLKTSKWIFLGQAIEWVICAGTPMPAAIVSHAWDEAERELFRAIDANGIVVEGYRSDDPSRVYETLPAGIWAHMNVSDDPNSGRFNPIDDLREDGGTIWLGDVKWYGARIQSVALLQHWPTAIETAPSRVKPSVAKNLLKPRTVKYPVELTEKWAKEFFELAEANGFDTRRDYGFSDSLEAKFPMIGTEVRNKLHKKFNPKPRAPKGA